MPWRIWLTLPWFEASEEEAERMPEPSFSAPDLLSLMRFFRLSASGLNFCCIPSQKQKNSQRLELAVFFLVLQRLTVICLN